MSGRLVVLTMALLAGPAVAADDAAQDVVLLVESRPLLLRLHISTDGRPFRAAHQEAADAYFAALFKHLDADKDGSLSEAESRRMPPPFKLHPEAGALAVNVAFNYRVVDDDGDGKISRAELAHYQLHFAGGPVQVQPAPRQPSLPGANEALFTRLDSDKDGKLSRDELTAAPALIEQLDLDRDELLAPLELSSAPVPVGMMGRRSNASAPTNVYLVTSDSERTDLAAALLARYGDRRRVSRERLGLDRETFEKLDADRDGTLNAAELVKFSDRSADLELTVRLGKRGRGEKALELFRAAPDDPRMSKDGLVRLTSGTAEVELRTNEDRPAESSAARRSLRDAFKAAAGDKPLTPRTARFGDFFPNHFALLDRDGDGKVPERELIDYLTEVQDRQAALIAVTPAILVADRPVGLIEMLDRDTDGRLSLRELRAAPALLTRLGREAEGSVGRSDLRYSYQMALGLGQGSFGRAGAAPMTPREMPLLTMDWARPELVWFTKMDRNRDGDVSAREFLGPRKRFTQLDEDGDGLISAEEARRAPTLPRD